MRMFPEPSAPIRIAAACKLNGLSGSDIRAYLMVHIAEKAGEDPDTFLANLEEEVDRFEDTKSLEETNALTRLATNWAYRERIIEEYRNIIKPRLGSLSVIDILLGTQFERTARAEYRRQHSISH